MTSSMMPELLLKMPIHIWYTLRKFHVDWTSLSKIIKDFRLGGQLFPINLVVEMFSDPMFTYQK